MSRFLLVASVSLFLLTSCNNRVNDTIRGPWSIDTIIYKRYDILSCLSLNIISFGDETCKLPVIGNQCGPFIEYVEKGYWSVEDTKGDPLVLNITTENEIFSGRHRVTFFKDTVNKLLFMRLKTDSLDVVCRKGALNYDHNQDLINDLVERSLGEN